MFSATSQVVKHKRERRLIGMMQDDGVRLTLRRGGQLPQYARSGSGRSRERPAGQQSSFDRMLLLAFLAGACVTLAVTFFVFRQTDDSEVS